MYYVSSIPALPLELEGCNFFLPSTRRPGSLSTRPLPGSGEVLSAVFLSQLVDVLGEKNKNHHHVFLIRPSEVKNDWFNRGGLTPLCLGHLLMNIGAGVICGRGRGISRGMSFNKDNKWTAKIKYNQRDSFGFCFNFKTHLRWPDARPQFSDVAPPPELSFSILRVGFAALILSDLFMVLFVLHRFDKE
ncbi:hypothetical protein K1719_014790 [Acacia pycnantha]|nr:hypothetical protein K1719_014790 [Acacia pycnantha]